MSQESTNADKPEKQPRVLVVDDEKITRRALEFVLSSEFDVTPLESGRRAIDHIRQQGDVDVVSLDLLMPGLSGIETLQGIKKHNPTVEVLLVTAHQDIESAKQALKFGAYDYIEKPVNKEAYRESIRKGVRRRQKALASERARQQLEIVKAQLVHTEKLSAIGELLAGVVHEINNPLAGIIGYSELLLVGTSSEEKHQKYLENIRQCALLCQKVVQKLLTFSRKHDPKREYLQVMDIMESTLELLQHEIKVSDVHVVRELSDNMPRTSADVHQIQQVFLNIISNAVQAMKAQDRPGTLTVKSECDARSLRIHIGDTGPGIPRENLQKIFEPFFTTKAEGKGTGLGLSICYEIIKDHGGDIYVSSEPGKGTYFVVELPVVSGDPSLHSNAAGHAADQEEVVQNILVISEKEMGYELLENMIAALKHRVDAAHDAAAALEKLEHGNFDVVISKMDMPRLNGEQLYEYVKAQRPEMLSKIILITSGVISKKLRDFFQKNRLAYISKPFGLDDIQTAIRKVRGA